MNLMGRLEIANFSFEHYQRIKESPSEVARGDNLAPGFFNMVLLLREGGEDGAAARQYPTEINDVQVRHGSGGFQRVEFKVLPGSDLGNGLHDARLLDGIWQQEGSDPLYTTGVLAIEGFFRAADANMPQAAVSQAAGRRQVASGTAMPPDGRI